MSLKSSPNHPIDSCTQDAQAATNPMQSINVVSGAVASPGKRRSFEFGYPRLDFLCGSNVYYTPRPFYSDSGHKVQQL